ncbi:hypothetical protein Lalb_Chr16g0378541 [Lupinus albus]|uniref:Uncharacterized protein n=1 Tax=Lupinus albus TaxID=3870 RepID=A0A6A4P9S5_LUPAL|nr:hypothetical protein Lalb_Chr16g0378541 [Lupinus albus]
MIRPVIMVLGPCLPRKPSKSKSLTNFCSNGTMSSKKDHANLLVIMKAKPHKLLLCFYSCLTYNSYINISDSW